MAEAGPRNEPAAAALTEVEGAAEASAQAVEKLQQRLRELEERMVQFQQQSRLDQEAVEQSRRRQAELEVASHALPWLLGLLVVLAAVAVGLAWRVQALTQRRRDVWWDTSAPLELDAPRDEAEAPVTAAVVFNEPAPAEGQAPHAAAPLTSAVLPVDEQIALSLQASRLIGQGQDDKAVELLQSRLEAGARTPWLLLKLLALYQCSGQRAAFDRLARQVAVRFGCTVPVWDAPPQPGLEADSALLQQLQQAWEVPVDALQALARLLLQPQSLPSLAVCEDLLLLYRIAHERHRQELSAEVDLPLPLPQDDDRLAQPLPAVSTRVALQPAP